MKYEPHFAKMKRDDQVRDLKSLTHESVRIEQ